MSKSANFKNLMCASVSSLNNLRLTSNLSQKFLVMKNLIVIRLIFAGVNIWFLLNLALFGFYLFVGNCVEFKFNWAI